MVIFSIEKIEEKDVLKIYSLEKSSAAIQGENDKLLLAARRIRRATSTDFVISLSCDDFSQSSSTYIGKLK